MIIIITCILFSFYRWVGLIYAESTGKFGAFDTDNVSYGRIVFIDFDKIIW